MVLILLLFHWNSGDNFMKLFQLYQQHFFNNVIVLYLLFKVKFKNTLY